MRSGKFPITYAQSRTAKDNIGIPVAAFHVIYSVHKCRKFKLCTFSDIIYYLLRYESQLLISGMKN